jgi:hypothetical protein
MEWARPPVRSDSKQRAIATQRWLAWGNGMNRLPFRAWAQLSRDLPERSGPDQRGGPHPPTNTQGPSSGPHLLVISGGNEKNRELIE